MYRRSMVGSLLFYALVFGPSVGKHFTLYAMTAIGSTGPLTKSTQTEGMHGKLSKLWFRNGKGEVQHSVRHREVSVVIVVPILIFLLT